MCVIFFYLTLSSQPPQLLVRVPQNHWRARAGGGQAAEGRSKGNEEDEGFESGDCDDEDECAGLSRLGLPPHRKWFRIFAGQSDTHRHVIFKLRLGETYSTKGHTD